MKTIVTGVLAFVIWSAASTYWYVYKIKDFSVPAMETSVPEPTEKPEPAAEPEPIETTETPVKVEIANPGLFTLNHKFDHTEIVDNNGLDIYLEEMTKFMQQNESSQVYVSSYADNVGTTDYNQSLAFQRATLVKAFLTEHGISGARIQITALGEQKPIASNSTEEGRAQNRRTTIEIK